MKNNPKPINARLLAALKGLAQVAVWDDDSDRDEFDAAEAEALAAIAEAEAQPQPAPVNDAIRAMAAQGDRPTYDELLDWIAARDKDEYALHPSDRYTARDLLKRAGRKGGA